MNLVELDRARRHKQARFRDPDRSLDSFDFAFNKKMNRALIHELATGRFIAQHEDALFLGPPGTGKSHLAQALGRAAIHQGHKVLYYETYALIEAIADAALDGTRIRPPKTSSRSSCGATSAPRHC